MHARAPHALTHARTQMHMLLLPRLRIDSHANACSPQMNNDGNAVSSLETLSPSYMGGQTCRQRYEQAALLFLCVLGGAGVHNYISTSQLTSMCVFA